MDLATNEIIGWHFSRNMDTEFVITTLNNAVKNFHIRQSFPAKGCPYDNAPSESFRAILKKELVNRRIFKDYE